MRRLQERLIRQGIALLMALFAGVTFACAPVRSDPFTFQHSARNPVVASGAATPWHFLSANPSAILFRGKIFFYFRGIAAPGAGSTVSVWTADQAGFDGIHWNTSPTRNPILAPGTPDSMEPDHILDPCAVVFHDEVYLYYMALKQNVGSIFLAVSPDGLHFARRGLVMRGVGTPGVVVNPLDGKLALFFSRRADTNKGWAYYSRTSTNGVTFDPASEASVLKPTGAAGDFDAQSISTARVLREDDYFYLTYGGCPTSEDYPEALGLARSKDLIHWQRYPVPICLRGATGSWNEGALWSGALLNVNGVYYLWYEGCGTNAGAGSNVSTQARNTSYGAYGVGSVSQIGLATYQGEAGALRAWSADFPAGATSLQNANSSLSLEVAGAKTEDGAAITQFSWWGGDSQQWRIERVGSFYKIGNVHSGRALETGGGSQLNGGKTLQWTWNATPNQQWHIVPVGGGRCHLVNRWSGMSLEVSGQSQAPLAPVDQWTWWGGSNQQWKLTQLPTPVK